MRLVLAQMKHETNTFSPVPTPIGRFARARALPPEGRAAYETCKGTGAALAAFIDLAERAGAEIDIPIAASAWPSGPVEEAAFEYIAERICAAVANGCDAVLLDLHGAMVTERHDDGEGELLRRIRRIAPQVPIGVALDMHANVTSAMVENATVIAGYQTYPHVDFRETGFRAGRPILALLAGEASPRMAWGRRSMLPHVMRQSSDDEPNRALQTRCRALEAGGALAASVFVGFPHADIADAGLSAVVVTDGDSAAQTACDALLDHAWAHREEFVYWIEPLARSIARAKAMTKGPVVLLDHYDNTSSGGTMDTTAVLRAIIEAKLENVAAFGICDPQAVEQMVRAGVGARVTLQIGGKLDMPAIGRKGEPLTVSGTVVRVTDGHFRNRGPVYAGVQMDMGPTVVLDTGKVEIVVTSKHQEPNDLECFFSVGIDPVAKRYLMLKSRIHWRAAFRPVIAAEIECAGEGVCTSDYDTLGFNNVRRPMFPLDRI
jgi:microcystin degradation protein MlrC